MPCQFTSVPQCLSVHIQVSAMCVKPPHLRLEAWMRFCGRFAAVLGLRTLFAIATFALDSETARAAEPLIDLSNAIIVSTGNASGPERKAVQMLAEEVTKRTRIRWASSASWPTN